MDGCNWRLFIGLLALLTKPVGLYLIRVLDPAGRTFLDPVMKPLERLLYRLLGIDPAREQDWRQYTASLILFSLAGLLFTYAILRLQHLLPLNPQGFGPLSPDLAFNTAASFTTNTNWQNYGGESTLSYFSQMVGLAFHNFVSAATGIAVAAALTRGIARRTAKTIGNFWTDLVRVNLYLLLPLCLVYALFLDLPGGDPEFQALRDGPPGRALRGSDPAAGQSRQTGPGRRRPPRRGGEEGGDPDDRPGAPGLPGGDQDAGDQRRRVHERQRRPPL